MKGESVDRSEAQPPVQAPPAQNQLPQKQTDAAPAPVATPAKPHTGSVPTSANLRSSDNTGTLHKN